MNLAQIHLAAEPGPTGGRLSTVFSFQAGTVQEYLQEREGDGSFER